MQIRLRVGQSKRDTKAFKINNDNFFKLNDSGMIHIRKNTLLVKSLCVMTWIGTFLAILITALAFWVLNFGQKSGGTQAVQSQVTTGVANLTLFVHVVGAFLCVMGARFLWNFKRKGFYFLLAGVLIPDIVSFSVFGNSFFTGTSMIIFAIPIVVIVLFGLQLKHMM